MGRMFVQLLVGFLTSKPVVEAIIAAIRKMADDPHTEVTHDEADVVERKLRKQ